jgi:hypothetical protein
LTVSLGASKFFIGQESTNIQAPCTREAPNSNDQARQPCLALTPPWAKTQLRFGAWCYSGAWMLVLGALSRHYSKTEKRPLSSSLMFYLEKDFQNARL